MDSIAKVIESITSVSGMKTLFAKKPSLKATIASKMETLKQDLTRTPVRILTDVMEFVEFIGVMEEVALSGNSKKEICKLIFLGVVTDPKISLEILDDFIEVIVDASKSKLKINVVEKRCCWFC
jgi:hypothetical protein